MELLTIRPARTDDATSILSVHREAVLAKATAHYSRSDLEAWAVGATPERVARVRQQIGDPQFIALVAEAGNQVIGFGVVVPSQQRLRGLYVKPNAIGRVGHRLLEELEKIGFASSEVLNCDASLNAVPFYKAHGYIEGGITNHLLSSGASVLCMKMKKVRGANNG